MTSDEVKRFPLPEPEPGRFETKRQLMGLFKQGPLETRKQFAERIVKTMQEHLAKSRPRTRAPKPDKRVSLWNWQRDKHATVDLICCFTLR